MPIIQEIAELMTSDASYFYLFLTLSVPNPHTPVAQKVADERVFRRFQGEGVEFFLNRTSLTPPQIFDVYLLENTNFSPFSFDF